MLLLIVSVNVDLILIVQKRGSGTAKTVPSVRFSVIFKDLTKMAASIDFAQVFLDSQDEIQDTARSITKAGTVTTVGEFLGALLLVMRIPC